MFTSPGARSRPGVSSGLFLQPSAGAIARAVRDKLREVVSVKDFGAVGDDATDCTAAFANAYNAIVVTGRGGIIYVPAGTYRLSSFPTVAAHNISLVGEGDFSSGSVLRHTAASGDFIVITGQHCFVRGLYFWPTQRKSAGYEIKISGSFHSGVETVRIDNAFNGIFINDSSETHILYLQLRYLLGTRGLFYGGSTGSFGARAVFILADNPYPVSSPTSASVKTWAITTAFTAGQIVNVNGNIYQCSTSGTSAGVGPGPAGFPSGTSPESAFSGTITDGTCQWKFVCNNNLQWITNDSFGNSLSIVSAALLNGAMGFQMSDSVASGSSFPQFFSSFDLEVDHAYVTGVALDGGNSALFANAWVGSTLNGNGLLINTNFKGEVAVGQSRIVGNAQHGILVQSGPVNNLIENSFILNNSAASSGTYHGILVANNATHVAVKGNRIGALFSGGNNQGFAFVSGGTSDYLIVTDNDVQGNVTAGISNGASGTHNIIRDNAGHNPVGATAATTMGASPFTYTAGATPETHYVKQAATNTATITQGGQQISALVGATTYYTIHLEPNESYVTTWVTTAPTYTKFVH
jgi:hypothetical protein